MVDVKLGNKTFEGVTAVKLNTTDGGQAIFPSESTSGGGTSMSAYDFTGTFVNGVCDLSDEAGQGLFSWINALPLEYDEEYGAYWGGGFVVVGMVDGLKVQTGTNSYLSVWWGGTNPITQLILVKAEQDGATNFAMLIDDVDRMFSDFSQLLRMQFEFDWAANTLNLACSYGRLTGSTLTVHEFTKAELNCTVEMKFIGL